MLLKDLIISTPVEEIACDAITYGLDPSKVIPLLEEVAATTPETGWCVISYPGWEEDVNQKRHTYKRFLEFYPTNILLEQGPPEALVPYQEGAFQHRILGVSATKLSYWPRPLQWNKSDLPFLIGAETGVDTYQYTTIPGLFLATLEIGFAPFSKKIDTILPVYCELYNRKRALDKLQAMKG